jgi:hypothetical protein
MHESVAVTVPADAYLESIREIIRSEVRATLAYAVTSEYQVVATDGTTIDAFPVDPTSGLPPVTSVPILTGIAGGSCTPTPGTHVGIGFLDANPAKPRLVGIFDTTTGAAASITDLQVNIGVMPVDGVVLQTALAAQLSALSTLLTTIELLLAAISAPFAAGPPPVPVNSLGSTIMGPLTTAVTNAAVALALALAVPNYSLTVKAAR